MSTTPADEEPGTPPAAGQVPPLVTEQWDGKVGITMEERWRKAIADVAEFSEEPEIRDAALAALATGDAEVIKRFAMVEKRQLETKVLARKRQTAADNLAKIQALKGTGGPIFNAEVVRVLDGSDYDRDAFLAYGADIARERDDSAGKAGRERATQQRERVKLLAAVAAPESQVKQAAEQALAGDDTAIAAFFDGGYLAAANADALAREKYLQDLEERNKAAEALSDLAQRAARASKAREELFAAHGEGIRALQRASNAMAAAANSARHAERTLAGNAAAQHKATELAAANTEAQRQVGYASQAAGQAAIAARLAGNAANSLDDTGLTYGAEWAGMAQGMSEAAAAAVGATQTAQHAIEATVATNAAQTAQARAEAHRKQAEQWRKHADEHAKAAKQLAVAAKKQAEAAKTAAVRTAKAREQAQAAEKKAWAAAERTRQQRLTAQKEAKKADDARIVAERERAKAAAHRAEAERQGAIARTARANAEAQNRIAASARERADECDNAAAGADQRAWEHEDKARQARDNARQAERDEQTAKAIAQAKRGWAEQAASGAERDLAQREAAEADRQAGIASGAARSARAQAHIATGAAASARAAAIQAEQAADRAWAAAQKAKAAAVAADAAADKAEAEAKATHAARVRADASAAEATAQQTKAAEAATAAVRMAEQAADEAVQAMHAAERTQAEADAAAREAVAASAQADIAVSAALAARASAAGIAEPANTALAMVSPFNGADIDADFISQVAEQAKIIGAEQSAAAKARADEAITAARKAIDAAKSANEQVPAAYTAAAEAAGAAAEAAGSAAEAKEVAVHAARDRVTARNAADGARKADAQARADAADARKAANEAAKDAAIAGRHAAAAQHDADKAHTLATAAENDAAAARSAATRAEANAAAAREAADSAQRHADSATQAAASALQHAIDGQAAADRAEEAERERAFQQIVAMIKGMSVLPTGEERDLLLAALRREGGGDEAEYKRLEAIANRNFSDYLRDALPGLAAELSGWNDVKGCFLERNFWACLGLAANLNPGSKGAKVAKELLEHAPKVKKFLDEANAARRKLDELKERMRRKKEREDTECPVPPKANGFLPAISKRFADGTREPVQRLEAGSRLLPTAQAANLLRIEAAADAATTALVDGSKPAGGNSGIVTATLAAAHSSRSRVTQHSALTNATVEQPRQLLHPPSGLTGPIADIQPHGSSTRVRNHTLVGMHTYYVIAGTATAPIHNTAPVPCVPVPLRGISRQMQDAHVFGTQEYNRRVQHGTPTSAFNSRAEADAYAQYAWENGTPVPGRPGVRDFDFGKPVGRGPNGGWQTIVRVHMNQNGMIHGHPKGREYN